MKRKKSDTPSHPSMKGGFIDSIPLMLKGKRGKRAQNQSPARIVKVLCSSPGKGVKRSAYAHLLNREQGKGPCTGKSFSAKRSKSGRGRKKKDIAKTPKVRTNREKGEKWGRSIGG